jgi:uncharacterized protein involved in tolerance to divalent cations
MQAWSACVARGPLIDLIQRANAEHPYDTPQVLALSVVDANPAYQRWVIHETCEPNDG